MAARETRKTIRILRDREKTWYGGGDGIWLSRLIDSEDGVASCFSSWTERLGLEATDVSVTWGFFKVPEDVKGLLNDILKMEIIKSDSKVA